MLVERPAAPETEQSPKATWLSRRGTDASIPGKQSTAKSCLTGTYPDDLPWSVRKMHVRIPQVYFAGAKKQAGMSKAS